MKRLKIQSSFNFISGHGITINVEKSIYSMITTVKLG